jgi:hypothetical protein
MPRTIDMTPTWFATIQIYVAVLESGTPEGKKLARNELLKIGQYLDRLKDQDTGVLHAPGN